MPYRTLHLQNFRSYADFTVDLGGAVNVVVGPNGAGKTNLLEALYVLSVGGSFRVADKDLTRHGQVLWRLEAGYDDAKRAVAYDGAAAKAQKQFTLDGAKRLRLSHQHKLPVVLFEPEHLRLLHGSPSGRRDYLDGLLARLQPDFSRLRSRFERVLQQRNNILKDAAQRRLAAGQLDDRLFAWDISFAELAQAITERRRGLLAYINNHAGRVYSGIAHRESQVAARYQSAVGAAHDAAEGAAKDTTEGTTKGTTEGAAGYKAELLARLRAGRDSDVARGFTGLGPHRDDFSIILDGADAGLSASRGEIRTLVLALKMIETELFRAESVRPPLLLFDDVFSELDQTRRTHLAHLARGYQTVITTTDGDMAREFFGGGTRVIKLDG